MKELIEAVKKLSEEELERANIKKGQHTSRHQAHAVLLEEVEEAEDELMKIKNNLELIWDDVKRDGLSKGIKTKLENILIEAVCLSAEAIQIAAMAQKFINYEKGKSENNEG